MTDQNDIRDLNALLQKSDVYDIACALRGPDRPNVSALKLLFTARIRSLAGMAARNPRAAVVRTGAFTTRDAIHALAEARAWRTADDSGYTHYVHHARVAARALGDLSLAELCGSFTFASLHAITAEDIIRLGGGEKE